ncbi:aminoglycoside phosphotransferase family protein [Streptomyces spirodelae]|uniref:Aminoglycoside phosphotransferase family protein n=1 Tax=Streptomyces spirodelae TaxID=2812904 RepID=A0ABS3WM90_9ACTN|nr:aminoglycoside phosphotransferase family protein [Streptomyces spirodelae]MBO8184232.1 aminoglycoside phosphotransferase family protein [Streptomyces spirodelae]
MTTEAAPALDALAQACALVGLNSQGAEPVRIAENQIWRLQEGVVARIARAGQLHTAQREVRVARWLTDHGVPAVRAASVQQPVETDGRPVTFWEELPPSEHGTVSDVALLLKQLHSLPEPDFNIGTLDPFVRVSARLDAATTLPDQDVRWLRGLHRELETAWAELPAGLPTCAVHGDAWPGNIVRTSAGPLMMDLERFSLGPPEWDLVSSAVRARTTGAVSPQEYEEFCHTYGHDVTDWAGYPTLAGARELRMVTYAAQHAASHPEWRTQAQHRVDCLRGRCGPRPWQWEGIP